MKKMLSLIVAVCLPTCIALGGDEFPKAIHFSKGAVNSIVIDRNGKRLAVNRGEKPNLLLLTHARRDVVEAARSSQAELVFAPEASKDFLELADQHWKKWWDERFNYYRQQVTRVPIQNDPADRYLKDGDEWDWQGIHFRFLSTPGYTRDGGSYLATIDGKKIAFTGDWILRNGKVPDLYSFQNEIREAKIGGYHGYMGRIALWLKTVAKVMAEKPDFIVPARGDILTRPEQDLARAADLAKKIYANYLRTNALHWYFGEERMGVCAARVLGPDHGIEGMPFAEHIDLPDWCRHIGTTKLLLSKDGNGFVLDVGGPSAIDALRKALDNGLIKKIDGIFVTHIHNDHTAGVGEAARQFGCPVYAVAEVADTLEHPGRWFLPGVSPNVVDKVIVKRDGETMRWKEFKFTFHFFPGQMYNHGALLLERDDHTPVYFIGDSFSPSGIDDYCLMNRNLMRDDTGYALCFRMVEDLPAGSWLVNQHIPHLFRFNRKELTFLETSYAERKKMIADFVAWDDPNFGIDEQWAKFYPYGQEITAGRTIRMEVRLINHSKKEREYTATLRGDLLGEKTIKKAAKIPARGEAELSFDLPISPDAKKGVHIITADIGIDDEIRLPLWCETLVKVGE